MGVRGEVVNVVAECEENARSMLSSSNLSSRRCWQRLGDCVGMISQRWSRQRSVRFSVERIEMLSWSCQEINQASPSHGREDGHMGTL